LVRPSTQLIAALSAYVPVRVTDMSGVDLRTFRFEWSLTFAVLLMNADGGIYRRFGSGDGRDSEAMLSEASFLATLAYGLEDHALGRVAETPEAGGRLTVEDLAPMKRRLAKQALSCVHCHTVGDMYREDAQAAGTFRTDDVWRHPPADRLGLRLDRDDQTKIVAVLPDSPAAQAGVRIGEHLVRVGGVEVRTEADARARLDRESGEAVTIEIGLAPERPTPHEDAGAARRLVKLSLPAGWRRGDALDLSWRSDMWHLRPNPGFGGPLLGGDAKAKLGLPRDAFALRVNYLIDFGPHPEDGRNAKKAGLKKGDVLLAVDGRSDFVTEREFQAWFRLTRKPGTTVALDVLSGGVRRTLQLPVLP
jgi:hypothetical protein